jgi:hypothetical protein
MLDKRKKPGRLAQLVELLPYKQAVTGSSPVPSIFSRVFTPSQCHLESSGVKQTLTNIVAVKGS